MAGEKEKEDDPATMEKVPINPNRTFYFLAHNGFSKEIKIVDLTQNLTQPHGTAEFEKEAKTISKELGKTSTPYLTLSHKRWYSRRYSAHHPSGSDKALVGEWQCPHFSTGTNHITFPDDSPHSMHKLGMKSKGFWNRKFQFVQDSFLYYWKFDDWTERRYSLWKIVGEQRLEIGKFWNGFAFSSGGVVVFDTTEIDDMVGLLTLAAMMNTKRQMDAERYS